MKNTPDDKDIPPNYPNVPKQLEYMINKHLDHDRLHDKIHDKSAKWFLDRIDELYTKAQVPTLEWLMSLETEESTYSQVSPAVRMAIYCISVDTYEMVFDKRVRGGITPEEDYLISLFRALILIGYSLNDDVKNGVFAP